ncbi:MAG TPA: hypothetical protein VFW33_16465 [Gemmataceae bacterium]|nr:hypothetical protein [Gemmataceae bacterium]
MKTLGRLLVCSFVLGPLAFLLGCSGGVTTEPATRRAGPVDDPLESARQLLAGSPDRVACGTALQQLNAYLSTHADKRPPALTDEQKAFLAGRFGLKPDEVAEVESSTYTLLDAPHLEFCFLMRDVARSLDAEALSPPERAATAFAWVTRQVVPREGEGALPPDFALRRGTGTALERGTIFLALLRQMGLPGCFLTTPGGTPWGCGALVEIPGSKEKQILVFDAGAGLPLPGAKGPPAGPLARAFRLALPVMGPEDGVQIATLAELRKQPALLAPLTVDEKHPYAVGAEQLKDTVVRLAPPLSALSPRMRTLQDDLLPQRAGVRPAVDPAKLVEEFGAAPGVEGGADGVRAREGAAGLTRGFLGEGEGGTDKTGQRSALARLAMLPQGTLPAPIRELEGDPGDRIRLFVLAQILTFQLEPRQPRDRVLRGQFKDASAQMVPLLEQISTQDSIFKKREAEVYEEFARWKKSLYEAYGKEGEARDNLRKGGSAEAAEAATQAREQVWKAGINVLALLVEGGTAESRRAQVMYQQGLCMHEQAERAQARADAQARGEAPDPDEVKAARAAVQSEWKDAAGWWTTYTQLYPRTPQGLHARLLLARAREAQGQPKVARALLEYAPPEFGELNRVNRLYLARRLNSP